MSAPLSWVIQVPLWLLIAALGLMFSGGFVLGVLAAVRR